MHIEPLSQRPDQAKDMFLRVMTHYGSHVERIGHAHLWAGRHARDWSRSVFFVYD
jgi:hypothetical protein